ncbi:BolA protein [Izhakiella capsodis]|uniref:DNA-binding transcriptional regulator BolA n=1 Tax=Izhakiella capsodis TaxID=1367852 RepID=A0A1I4YHM2_9GAMM|nr:transcriptional regulator BolA [Izhakiella capsodis]SFN37079.1 BolA protein [Izhakiella capsodis]
MLREQIEVKLRAAFNPQHLEVVDESFRHNVQVGSESHFNVVIVSECFIDQRFLQRHRAIYSELAEEMAGSIHALALHTYTGKEWEDQQDRTLSSPNCRGAGIQA